MSSAYSIEEDHWFPYFGFLTRNFFKWFSFSNNYSLCVKIYLKDKALSDCSNCPTQAAPLSDEKMTRVSSLIFKFSRVFKILPTEKSSSISKSNNKNEIMFVYDKLYNMMIYYINMV